MPASHHRLLLAVAALLLLLASSAARAETRLALVIGQSAYRSVPALPNPANDARMVAKLLTEAGFDVETAADLNQSDMQQAISRFAAKIGNTGPDTVALLFYAGHGLQVDGENYLVPVDVDPKREADIPLQAVRLNDVLNTLASVPNRMRILLLDACRDNPFPGLSTAGKGLAMVDARTSATGTFISYSTSPGAQAEDGRGDDSPYTTALLQAAHERGLTIEETFKRVRMAVNKDTDGRQTPWDSSSLTDAFRLFPQQGQDETRAPTPTVSAEEWKKRLKGKDPQAAYDLVVADDSIEAYQAFVTLYAQPPFAPRVRTLLDRRREMVAWQDAVLINTAASYQAFLLGYSSGDLAATARRLMERVRNHPLPPAVAAVNASLTCPCSQPSPPIKLKKADETPARSVKKSRHATDEPPPRRRRPPPGEPVVEEAPPPAASIAPIIGGIGLAVGGLRLGGGGRGGGYVPSTGGGGFSRGSTGTTTGSYGGSYGTSDGIRGR